MDTPKTHPMPLSLRLIKEATAEKIEWRGLHIIDLFSILYSIRIDNARRYMKSMQQKSRAERGIENVVPANESDFDSL